MKVIQGMYGLGDSIYQRSVLREIKETVYLRTAWPQLYKDLPNIKPVRPSTNLRTQNKNISRIPANTWHFEPNKPSVKMSYSSKALQHGSILKGLSECVGVEPKTFDVPKFKGPDMGHVKPYAVVRPVTLRSEWLNRARGPEPEYVCRAADILREEEFTIMSVADLTQKEWCEKLPRADINFNHGELCFEELMGLIQGASVVVGGVGWIVPACVAAGVPLITILGGQGGHNAPEKIIDNPMNDSKVRFIKPENYCMCRGNRHACDKTIKDFDSKFNKALEDLPCWDE